MTRHGSLGQTASWPAWLRRILRRCELGGVFQTKSKYSYFVILFHAGLYLLQSHLLVVAAWISGHHHVNDYCPGMWLAGYNQRVKEVLPVCCWHETSRMGFGKLKIRKRTCFEPQLVEVLHALAPVGCLHGRLCFRHYNLNAKEAVD